jgi:hypothetical protein
MMRSQVYPYQAKAVDPYARGQVGWRDSDGDGILDPMDTTLSASGVTYVANAGRPNVLTFGGIVQDDPYPSPLRRSTLINKIERVQYHVADGGWAEAHRSTVASTHTPKPSHSRRRPCLAETWLSTFGWLTRPGTS